MACNLDSIVACASIGSKLQKSIKSKVLFLGHTRAMSCLISQFLRAQQLVNLAGRVLLHGPLNFKAVFVAKMFRDLSPSIYNFLFLDLNAVLYISFTYYVLMLRVNSIIHHVPLAGQFSVFM